MIFLIEKQFPPPESSPSDGAVFKLEPRTKTKQTSNNNIAICSSYADVMESFLPNHKPMSPLDRIFKPLLSNQRFLFCALSCGGF